MAFSESILIQAAEAMDLKWAYFDSKMVYRQVSSQYCAWHKTSRDAILDRSVKDLLSQDTIERLTPYWQQSLSGDVVTFSGQIQLTGASTFSFVKATYIPCFGGAEQVIGFYVFYEDQTQDNKAISTLRKLHMITADMSLPLDNKIEKILRLGIEVFELPIALVSHIVDERYEVKYAVVPEEAVKPGDTFDLGVTYCFHTLKANGPTAFHHAGESYINKHPCYDTFGLESYIGIPIFVNNERYGTLNFSSADIHDSVFSEHDYELIRLFSQWIGNELGSDMVRVELEMQSRLLNVMSKQARIGTWELNINTGELYWSHMTKEIHEVTQEFVPKLDEAILFYKQGESRDRVSQAVDRAVMAGESWDLDIQLVTAKGNVIWVNAMGQPEMDEGECVRLFGSFQDINERIKNGIELEKAKIQAEAAAKSKSEFLANMSHEIRTPMNGVLGMINSVLNSALTDKQQYQLDLAQRSAQSLLSLINDILDFSKVDAGMLELEAIDFDLYAFLSDVGQSMLPMIEDKNLVFIQEFDPLKGLHVRGDPNRVRQILTNLLGNAIKFTQAGSITLQVSLQAKDTRQCCRVKVIDTGIGIASNKMTALCDAFTQADASTTRQFGGTGLGLAIVKNLCKLMDGDLSISSELGKGSCFEARFYLDNALDSLPLKGQEIQNLHDKLDLAPCAPVECNATLSGSKILLVEDNFINQEVAREQLNQLSIDPDIAHNGQEAIKLLNESTQEPYKLVLMDCQMPVLDGYEATKLIRSGEAGSMYLQVPVVALTANAMKGDREKCLAAGMDDYLSKPFDSRALKSVLKKYLQPDD